MLFTFLSKENPELLKTDIRDMTMLKIFSQMRGATVPEMGILCAEVLDCITDPSAKA
jgi:hypothetical protein